MDIYEGSGKKPQIGTSDNAFKIILPNLNAQTEKEQISDERDSQEEKVIQLARKQGMVTRQEVEKLLDIGQTTSGRLLKKIMKNGQLIQEGKGKITHYRLSK